MEKERRKKARRQSDLMMQKTVEVLRALESISKGQKADFGEAYADLVGMKDKLGRRKEDRKLGDCLCSTIEAIAGSLGAALPVKGQSRDTRTRKVRLKKLSGTKGEGITRIGWEDQRPLVGKRYRVFLENGGTIRTSVVTRVAPGYIRTRRSVYQLEVLKDQRNSKTAL